MGDKGAISLTRRVSQTTCRVHVSCRAIVAPEDALRADSVFVGPWLPGYALLAGPDRPSDHNRPIRASSANLSIGPSGIDQLCAW